MTTFFLTDDIKIELIPQSAPVSDAKFIFAANGSLVAAGHLLTQENATIGTLVDESMGSEHWMTDASDFFRFYEAGSMHSIVLSVPPENAPFNSVIPQPQHGYFSLWISPDDRFFTVARQAFRCFNPLRRELYCFTHNAIPKTVCRISKDFSLVFNKDNVFSGWILNSPLENLTASFQGDKDDVEADAASYEIFADYFELMSDNECARYDDKMGIVVEKLLAKLHPQRMSTIKGRVRRELLTQALAELKDDFVET